METSLNLSPETIRFGYYTLNPETENAKDDIYNIVILGCLRDGKKIEIASIKSEISKRIALPEYKLELLIKLLLKEKKIETTDGHYTLTIKGKDYLTNIETTINNLTNDVKNILEKYFDENEISIIFDIIDFLADKDSEFIEDLIGLKKQIILTELESVEIENRISEIAAKIGYKKDPKILTTRFQEFMDTYFATNDIFREFFLTLVYGHVAEYILLSTTIKEKRLFQIFEDLKKEIGDTIFLLDTNVIISLVCHYDKNNYLINSLLKFIKTNKPDIKFKYSKRTREELFKTLNKDSLRQFANIVQHLDKVKARDILERWEDDEKDQGIRSPLLAYYYEDKYKDWDHYLFMFAESLKYYKKYFGIEEIDYESKKLEMQAERYTKFYRFDVNIAKSYRALEHDISLILLANNLSQPLEEKSLIKKVIILTFDSKFEKLEDEIIFSNDMLTRRSLNLRQFITYLTPLFSLKNKYMRDSDKSMYGYVLRKKKNMQEIIKNANIELLKESGIISKYSDYELMKTNKQFYREFTFSLLKESG